MAKVVEPPCLPPAALCSGVMHVAVECSRVNANKVFASQLEPPFRSGDLLEDTNRTQAAAELWWVQYIDSEGLLVTDYHSDRAVKESPR